MTDPEYDDVNDRGPRFPAAVKAAGIIWIVYGVFQVIVFLANFALAAGAAPGGANPWANGAVCGGVVGAVFFFVGAQTVRGTAKDVMGNSIGSIVFSLLFFAVALFMIAGGALLGQVPNGPAGKGGPPANQGALQFVALVTGVGFAFFGLLLMLAGILALSGRTAYREWREANFPTERRRRRREEDYEEGDDRDRRRRE
jgi:hypothetical protein